MMTMSLPPPLCPSTPMMHAGPWCPMPMMPPSSSSSSSFPVVCKGQQRREKNGNVVSRNKAVEDNFVVLCVVGHTATHPTNNIAHCAATSPKMLGPTALCCCCIIMHLRRWGRAMKAARQRGVYSLFSLARCKRGEFTPSDNCYILCKESSRPEFRNSCQRYFSMQESITFFRPVGLIPSGNFFD